MTDNLEVWNKLSRTDPDHTKAFIRGGGFRGTAIKPIYTELKMTETFGPCGTGWGYSEPTFQIVACQSGEQAVFCWLNLWYLKEDGQRSEPIPGVGGDFVVKSNKGELRTDDEAFKKAATDALGNAMKHIGMSADVHMGRFDDNKYVAEVREEVRQAANGNGKRTQVEISANAKRKRREYELIPQDLAQIETLAELEKYEREVLTQEFMEGLGQGQFAVNEWVADKRKELEAPVETKAEFVRRCHAIIEEASAREELLTWWNSRAQKEARRQHKLTIPETQELMARVTERCKGMTVDA